MANENPDLKNAKDIGAGIGGFFGNILTPIIGNNTTTTQATTTQPSAKSTTAVIVVVVIVVVAIIVLFTFSGKKTTEAPAS